MLYSEHVSIGSKGLGFKDKMGRELSFNQGLEKVLNRLYSYVQDVVLYILKLTGYIPFYFVRYLVYSASGIKIGHKSHIHMGAQFFDPQSIEIGAGTIVGQRAFLDGRGGLIIGNNVDIASEVMIYTSEHNINADDFVATSEPVEIGDYVFIGPRVIILPGVKVGRGAVLAAGAVVTRAVGEFEIVGGVPAKVIGERTNKDLHYRLGRARLFQ